MKFSVLMNTFNRSHFLRLALRSYLRQTEGDFEIVVADDGSTDDTPAVVAAFQELAPFEVHYVRQEHENHRRAAILNRGLEHCSGEQVLFTDCDSIAWRDLVAVHRSHAEPDRLLCGGYVRLDEEETEGLTDEAIVSGRFESLMDDRKRKILRNSHWKACWEIFRRKPRRPHNMGLNYSCRLQALVDINGYDESFQGWGSADGEVRERLRRLGVKPYSLYNKAIVLHQHHPVAPAKLDKDLKRRNREHANRRDIPIFCENGMVKASRSAGKS